MQQRSPKARIWAQEQNQSGSVNRGHIAIVAIGFTHICRRGKQSDKFIWGHYWGHVKKLNEILFM